MNKPLWLAMFLCLQLLIGMAKAQDEFGEPVELPGAVERLLDSEKYGEPGYWGFKEVKFQPVEGGLDEALLKSGPLTNHILDKPSATQLEQAAFKEMTTDSAGYVVILGDSLEVGGVLHFFKPSLHVRELILYGVTDCRIELVGKYERITLLNCRNISIAKDDADFYSLGYFTTLSVQEGIHFNLCSFDKEFSLYVNQGGGKVFFEECAFGIDKFQLSIPDSAKLVFSNSPLAGIRKFVPKWAELSQWLVPEGFLFWGLREIDSLGEKYCTHYDACLSSESNKLAWVENHKIVLHQFQEYYHGTYEFEKADSVFRTLKDLERDNYLYEYSNPRNKDSFKSAVHYYFMSFMGWFCGYGTEPIMALYNAFQLILLFALLYIFFPTRFNDRVPLAEDGFFFLGLRIFSGEETEIDRILSSFKTYLQSNPSGTIWTYYHHRKRRILATYRKRLPTGIAYYIAASTHTNRVGKILIGAYVQLSMLPYLANLMVLSIFEARTRKRWEFLDHQGKKASFIQMLDAKSVLLLLGGLVFILLARIPVGLLISINAFSTLGFGNLPLRGFTKYVAILEGLVGWFTLTLFSITYVNILLR